MILLILLALVLVLSCTHDGRTRRLILGIESLPMSEPEAVVVTNPIAIEPASSAVTYKTIIVEPPKKHKKSYRKKTRQRRGHN